MIKVITIILLILLSPLFLIITIAILLDDGFPIFFKQKRFGKNNIHFDIIKFRTMKKNTPDVPTHLLEVDKKIYTKFGLLFRKLSLDELPQLLNIIKGEMVFIGPRPALHNQEDLIQKRTLKGIHRLYPGITGWAQVNGRDELTISEKVNMDLYYLNNRSLKLNLMILWLTLLKVVKTEGVSL